MREQLFAIVAYDRPKSEAERAAHREGHLSHFQAHKEQLVLAGPLSGALSGSLVIIQASSEDDARAFIEADPFFPAGVWERIEVFAFKAASGMLLR